MNAARRFHVLIVDDVLSNIEWLANILDKKYNVSFATGGAEALDLMSRLPIDIVLLDVVMPEMDGFEVCRKLKANALTRDIPVVFLTGLENPVDEEFGLNLGAEDFLHKSVSPPVVLARVSNHLQLSQARRELKRHNVELERLVEERTREVIRQSRQIIASQDATIMAFCALAEARDNETGNHIRRTQHYVRVLAERLRDHRRFRDELDGEVIELLFKSAPLHDVGKVAIPDSILLKPGKLTAEEWVVMKTHCVAGQRAIVAAARELADNERAFLERAAEIALGHHERWDGSGYPQGLCADEIPLGARLMAVADVYDALTSRRAYKEPFAHQQSIEMMAAERGRHFDPDILDALLSLVNVFRDIGEHYRDLA